MGMSTSGILAYGFDLGGPEKWEVREAGEYGELPPLDWYNEDDENSYFIEAAERRLLASIGFTETWHQGNEGYFRREREARAQLGVAFETYCSGDYPMHLLTTKVITAYGGDAHQIDVAEQAQAPAAGGWDAKLTQALRVLGLTPVQERARWLLCSYWG